MTEDQLEQHCLRWFAQGGRENGFSEQVSAYSQTERLVKSAGNK